MLKRYNILERRLVDAQDEAALISFYISPDDQELKQLVNGLELDAHTLHSALDPDEVPRVELAPEYVAAIIKRPTSYTADDNLSFRVSTAGVFLLRDRLVIVLPEEAPLIDTAQQLKQHTAPSLFVHILERLITHFREHLKIISLIIEELEGRLPALHDARPLTEAYALTKSLVYYVEALAANARLFDELDRNAGRFGLDAEDRELLADATLENRQCQKQAEVYVSLLTHLVATRSAITRHTLSVRVAGLTRLVLATVVPLLIVSVFAVSPLATAPWGFWAMLGLAGVAMLVAWVMGRPGS